MSVGHYLRYEREGREYRYPCRWCPDRCQGHTPEEAAAAAALGRTLEERVADLERKVAALGGWQGPPL